MERLIYLAIGDLAIALLFGTIWAVETMRERRQRMRRARAVGNWLKAQGELRGRCL